MFSENDCRAADPRGTCPSVARSERFLLIFEGWQNASFRSKRVLGTWLHGPDMAAHPSSWVSLPAKHHPNAGPNLPQCHETMQNKELSGRGREV